MGEKRRGRSRQGGFTLTEIIIVVAIVAIVMAAALPSLQIMLVNMEMVRLDNSAKQVYLVAQNRLVALRVAGTLQSDVSSKASDLTDLMLGNVKLAFTDKTKGVMEYIVPPGGAITPGIHDTGNYVVVFDKVHGVLQEVFYAENGFGGVTPTEEQLTKWRNDAKQRRSDRVGFYEGRASFASSVQQLEPLKMQIVNDEQLLLKLTLPQLPTGVTVDDVTIIVTVEDASGSGTSVTWELNCNRGFDQYDATTQTCTKILDQFGSPSKSFQHVLGSNITPGANIKISAKLKFTGTAKPDAPTYLPSHPTTQVTNSLFATATKRNGAAGEAYASFTISSGRHLQNLVKVEDLTYDDRHGGLTKIMNGVDEKKYYVMQTDDIDFSAGSEWENIYGQKKHTSSAFSGMVSYDGRSQKIIGLTSSLFLTFGSTYMRNTSYEIRGVNIESPNMTSGITLSSQFGSLVGMVQKGQVVDCHVYGSQGKINIRGATYIGGLVGSLYESEMRDCSVVIPEMTGETVSGNKISAVGGLVGVTNAGSVDRVMINNCYANIDNLKVDTMRAGMLLGTNDASTTIYNCYMSGNISGNAVSAGGLVGGITRQATGERYFDCYSLVKMNLTVGEQNGRSQKYAVLVPPQYSRIDASHLYYVQDVAGADALADGYSTDITLENLKNGTRDDGTSLFTNTASWSIGGTQSQPYSSSLTGNYPYPGLAQIGIHRGDWIP